VGLLVKLIVRLYLLHHFLDHSMVNSHIRVVHRWCVAKTPQLPTPKRPTLKDTDLGAQLRTLGHNSTHVYFASCL
jgi:hypothetical protein